MHARTGSGRRPRLRPRGALIVLVAAALLLPLPWRTVAPASAPGTAWRLDGRLEVDGAVLDPPGATLWLAAGRPPLLVERLAERLGRGDPTRPLTGPAAGAAPADAVPAAVAVALAVAGADATDRDVTARITLRLGPLDLGRAGARLGLGDSHGLAVAVSVLRAGGSLDLGDLRVAATGRIGPDGGVEPVGGIGPKARAAARAGADLLLVPSGQEREAATALRDIARAPRVVAIAALTELLASPAVTDVPLEPEVGT